MQQCIKFHNKSSSCSVIFSKITSDIITVALEFFLIVPTVSCLGFTLCVSKFIDGLECNYPLTDLAKNMQFRPETEIWLKFSNLWLKYQTTLICPSRGTLYQIFPLVTVREMLILYKCHHLTLIMLFSLSWCYNKVLFISFYQHS